MGVVVCERHFQPEDIVWVTSYHDERTGRTLTAKLERPRLRKGAIPSILPGHSTECSAEAAKKSTPLQSTSHLHQRRNQSHKKEDVKPASTTTPRKVEVKPQRHLKHMLQDEEENEEIFDDDLEVEIKEEVVDDDLPVVLDTVSYPMERTGSPEVDFMESRPSTSYISVTPLHKFLPMDEKPITSHTRLADMDEFHLFGMNVASQLRALPLHEALQAEVQIQKILAEKRSQRLT